MLASPWQPMPAANPEPLLIRCGCCGNILGAPVAGQIVMRYRGREWIGLAVSIKCEKCAAVWVNPSVTVAGTIPV